MNDYASEDFLDHDVLRLPINYYDFCLILFNCQISNTKLLA